jgi:hypothetical protein
MTLVLGVMCQDGVVIGADSAATYVDALGAPTIQQPTDKIWTISKEIILASSGDVGLSQRIRTSIENYWPTFKTFDQNTFLGQLQKQLIIEIKPQMRIAAQCPADLRQQALSNAICVSLMALIHRDRFLLIELNTFGAATLHMEDNLPFVSIGSGQRVADPLFGFLKYALWPSGRFYVSDAELVIAWILDTVIHINPGGVGGEKVIYRLTRDELNLPKITEVTKDGIGETMQFIKDVTEVLREYKADHFGNVLIPKELLPPQS